MNVRSTNSPPPLISNSEYLVDKNESNLSAGNNGSSAFMMQFMTAAAAAAMAAASKKSEIQESKRDTYSNSNAYDNVSSTGRRCSSSFSSRQNASPSSTTSSSRSLLGVDGTRSSSISLKKMTTKYRAWNQKHNEVKELTTAFDLFESTNGAKGINPNLEPSEIKQLYDSTPSLHCYNPRYFRGNFKNLVSNWEINKHLTTGRSKYFFKCFPFLKRQPAEQSIVL